MRDISQLLFNDLKSDEEKSAFFLSGRAYETGVVASTIQNELAMAYHQIVELKKELAEAQRDAERLDWIIEHRAYVVSDPDCCDGYWLNYLRPDGIRWVQLTEYETPRAAIDAAMGEPS